MGLAQKEAIHQMFTHTELNCLGTEDPSGPWAGKNIFAELATFFILYWLMTITSINFPIPAGVFTPVFLLGAVFGRLYGEGVRSLMPEKGGDSDCFWDQDALVRKECYFLETHPYQDIPPFFGYEYCTGLNDTMLL